MCSLAANPYATIQANRRKLQRNLIMAIFIPDGNNVVKRSFPFRTRQHHSGSAVILTASALVISDQFYIRSEYQSSFSPRQCHNFISGHADRSFAAQSLDDALATNILSRHGNNRERITFDHEFHFRAWLHVQLFANRKRSVIRTPTPCGQLNNRYAYSTYPSPVYVLAERVKNNMWNAAEGRSLRQSTIDHPTSSQHPGIITFTISLR